MRTERTLGTVGPEVGWRFCHARFQPGSGLLLAGRRGVVAILGTAPPTGISERLLAALGDGAEPLADLVRASVSPTVGVLLVDLTGPTAAVTAVRVSGVRLRLAGGTTQPLAAASTWTSPR